MSLEPFFPLPSQQVLRSAFVGKSLQDVPAPSAILDLAKVKKNCQLMLDACKELQISFRAHIKTHKTVELTRLQIGENKHDVRVIVSTMMEAESICELLKEYQDKGAKVSVLYAVPLAPSLVSRLAALAAKLGPGTVSSLIDNSSQLESALKFKAQAGFPLSIFIKTDSGYHRAGILPESSTMVNLVREVDKMERQSQLKFIGFYSHNSLSYSGSSPDDAMDMLKVEIDACRLASQHLSNLETRSKPLVISVGASPSALSIQNLVHSSASTASDRTRSTTLPADSSSSGHALRQSLDLQTPSSALNFELEIHAGVYTVHDIQQVSASSRAYPSPLEAHLPIAFTVLAEITSLYPDRTSTPEALINAGCLALSREPCKDYSGWGVVTDWNMISTATTSCTPLGPPSSSSASEYTAVQTTDPSARIIVKRISQEHGILGWENEQKTEDLPFRYGQKVRLWPNHACITGSGFGWYLVVDSEANNGGGVVEDVYVRFRGW